MPAIPDRATGGEPDRAGGQERVERTDPAAALGADAALAHLGACTVIGRGVGAYVALMLRAVGLRPTPFVVSFTCYFIGLYAMEALFLSRLFAGAMKQSER